MPPPRSRSEGRWRRHDHAHQSVLHTALAATRCRRPHTAIQPNSHHDGAAAAASTRPEPAATVENAPLTRNRSSGMPIPRTRRDVRSRDRSGDRYAPMAHPAQSARPPDSNGSSSHRNHAESLSIWRSHSSGAVPSGAMRRNPARQMARYHWHAPHAFVPFVGTGGTLVLATRWLIWMSYAISFLYDNAELSCRRR